MPVVNGKKYPYTDEGISAANKARTKKQKGGKASRMMYKNGGEVMPKAKPC